MKSTSIWNPGLHQSNDGELSYQLFTPSSSPGEKVPLFIFLHGTGEAGTDNEKQLMPGTGIGPGYFVQHDRQQKHPCYVLAPQSPEEIRWAGTERFEYDLDETPITSVMVLLLQLIDSMIRLHPIDTTRIYLGGMSRGGQGTWNACFHRPDLFAAAYATCCSASPSHAHRVKEIPFWIFHGDADEVTSVEYSRNMIRALRPYVPDPDRLKYTEIPGGDHQSAWLRAHQSDALQDWLFSWKKNLSTTG